MMLSKQSDSGVSPVIGVILMVAITVIIAAVVANFVLGLGGTLGQDADATVSFDQSANFEGDGSYDVEITASNMDNADYLTAVVLDADNDGDDLEITHRTNADEDALEDDSVPDRTNSDDLTEDGAIVAVSSGDSTTIENFVGEEEIQVFGSLDGEETLITTYSLDDTQGFTDDNGGD